jgi:hypothetical protein
MTLLPSHASAEDQGIAPAVIHTANEYPHRAGRLGRPLGHIRRTTHVRLNRLSWTPDRWLVLGRIDCPNRGPRCFAGPPAQNAAHAERQIGIGRGRRLAGASPMAERIAGTIG